MLSVMLVMVLISTWVSPGVSRDPWDITGTSAQATGEVTIVHSEEICYGLGESCGAWDHCCKPLYCNMMDFFKCAYA